uniref:Protein kinase domain-containing protein n=1 Tax=Haemonchus contortus TaxID=6289 RepID=A0A7I4YJ81_HAECO
MSETHSVRNPPAKTASNPATKKIAMSDLKGNRKLREMFRRFQNNRKEREEDDGDVKVTARVRSSTVSYKTQPNAARSGQVEKDSGKKQSQSSGNEQEGPRTLEERGPTAEDAAIERKRRNIRMKYGISRDDEESYRRTTEDQEEFENVNAVARPAATRMHTHKLKWKAKNNEKESYDTGHSNGHSNGKGALELTDDLTEPISESEAQDQKISEIKSRAGYSGKQTSPEGGLSRESSTEVKVLILRIEELELANKKMKLQMKGMQKRIREKDKKIEELISLNAYLQRCASAEEHRQEEKVTPEQEAIALRGLEIMHRNHLLEDTIKNVERTLLRNFFEASDPRPTPTVVMLIDKALSHAIEVILTKSNLFDDFVDNELRIFLLNSTKAKRILLDEMLLHPEYVPNAWGGDVLRKRRRLEEQNVEITPSPLPVDKTACDDETSRKVTNAENPPVKEQKAKMERSHMEIPPVMEQKAKFERASEKEAKTPVKKEELRKSTVEAAKGKTDKGKEVAKAEQKAPVNKKPEPKAETKPPSPNAEAPPPRKIESKVEKKPQAETPPPKAAEPKVEKKTPAETPPPKAAEPKVENKPSAGVVAPRRMPSETASLSLVPKNTPATPGPQVRRVTSKALY